MHDINSIPPPRPKTQRFDPNLSARLDQAHEQEQERAASAVAALTEWLKARTERRELETLIGGAPR